jgi:hypothetical protein
MLSFAGFETRDAASPGYGEACNDEACLVWSGDGK